MPAFDHVDSCPWLAPKKGLMGIAEKTNLSKSVVFRRILTMLVWCLLSCHPIFLLVPFVLRETSTLLPGDTWLPDSLPNCFDIPEPIRGICPSRVDRTTVQDRLSCLDTDMAVSQKCSPTSNPL